MQTENYKLSLKAASAFHELTPRYSEFKETFSTLGIKMVGEKGKKLVSNESKETMDTFQKFTSN